MSPSKSPLVLVSLILSVFSLNVSVHGQSTGQQNFVNGIAAVVEDRVITIDDVRKEISLLMESFERRYPTEAEFNRAVQEMQDEVIQSLVDRVLIVKEFAKEGFQIPNSYIENEMDEILREDFGGDRSQFLGHLREAGVSVRQFRKEVEERIIVRFMRDRMRKSEAIVSPVRIEEFYRNNNDRFFREEAIYLRLIQLSVLTSESREVLRQTAEKVTRELENGEDFAELARRYSQDRRRTNGGSWGWIDVSDLRNDWREIADNLEPGEFSEPLETNDGIFILYIEDRREAGTEPLDEVRDEIETILIGNMARSAQERWLERLRRNAYVRYF